MIYQPFEQEHHGDPDYHSVHTQCYRDTLIILLVSIDHFGKPYQKYKGVGKHGGEKQKGHRFVHVELGVNLSWEVAKDVNYQNQIGWGEIRSMSQCEA
jgi:hypothetical protein